MEFDGRARIQTELNIAPLIDVVFLLLIFFMLTSTLITQEGIELTLPGSSQSTTLKDTPITVSIARDGSLSLNGTDRSEHDLSLKLKSLLSQNADQPVILKSDVDVNVQQLVSTMDLIQQAGGSNISIATKQRVQASVDPIADIPQEGPES